jgi:hypothetical protein
MNTSKMVHLGEAAALYGLRQEIKESIRFPGEGLGILLSQLDCIYCDGPEEYPTSVFTGEPKRLSSKGECQVAVTLFNEWCNVAMQHSQIWELFGTSSTIGASNLWYCAQKYPPEQMQKLLDSIYSSSFKLLKPYARNGSTATIDLDVWCSSISLILDKLGENEICSKFVAARQLLHELNVVFGFEFAFSCQKPENVFRIAEGLNLVKAMSLTRPQRNLLLQQATKSSLLQVLSRIEENNLQAIMVGNAPYVYSLCEATTSVDGYFVVPIYRADEFSCCELICVKGPDGELFTVNINMVHNHRTKEVTFHNSSGKSIERFMADQTPENAAAVVDICKSMGLSQMR